MTLTKIKILELFSGYGTSSFALKKIGIKPEIVGFSDIDKYANKIFEQNHWEDMPMNNEQFDKRCETNKRPQELGDVRLINPNDLPDFDLLTGGFPCQAFSTAGKMNGELDPRGSLFYEIIRIAEVKKPKYMLLENVKGLTCKKFKDTFDKILSELDRIGYKVHWKILNTKDYGIPQNRARVWFVCFREQEDYDKFTFPEKEELKIFIKDILEPSVDSKYYLSDLMQERFAKYLEEKESKKLKENPNLQLIEGEDLVAYTRRTRDLSKVYEYAKERYEKTGKPIQIDIYHLFHSEIRPITTFITENEDISRCIQSGEPKEVIYYPPTQKKNDNLVYDRNGFSSRKDGFKESELSPTLSTKMGTGGNNVPMIHDMSSFRTRQLQDSEVCDTLQSAMSHGNTIPLMFIDVYNKKAQELCPALKDPIHNDRRVSDGKAIRKLTPKECFRLQGFLNDEINISGVSDTRAYKLAGNGQTVTVVEKIFRQMFKEHINGN